MFDDRPRKPGRKMDCQWLEPDDPDFKVAQELKRLTHKHTAEVSHLMELQLQEEGELHKQQTGTLKGYYDKFKKMESVMADGTARRLAHKYNLRLPDD